VFLPVYWMAMTSLRHQSGFLTKDQSHRRSRRPPVPHRHQRGLLLLPAQQRNVSLAPRNRDGVVADGCLYAIVRGRGLDGDEHVQDLPGRLAIPLQAAIISSSTWFGAMHLYDMPFADLPNGGVLAPISILIPVTSSAMCRRSSSGDEDRRRERVADAWRLAAP
jgi:hypothetical protein